MAYDRGVGRFERSVQLASASGRVLRANPPLVGLAVLSLAASAAVLVAVAAPLRAAGHGTMSELAILGAIAVLLVGLVQAYFHAALTIGAIDHFEQRRPTIASTTRRATALLPVLMGWALIGWLVSALAAIIRDRIPLVGPLLSGLGQAIWGVVTYLSMPTMVAERCGPIAAIRRSGTLLRTTWGENLLAQLGFGLYSLALAVPVAIVGVIGFAIHPWVGVALWAVGLVAVCSYISALDAVYRVALYRYATIAETPAEFALAGFDTAFETKKRRWFSPVGRS